MNGSGMIRGLWVTFRRFLQTYITDLRYPGKRYYTKEGVQSRSSASTDGIFTVQYPEEKLIIPEEFRYFPFLVYEEVDGAKKPRCTSCGICSKVCPPQCIWITRKLDPQTGKPMQEPAEFYIDVDICMNCGLCAEFCPFDAIRMDHDYEISAYTRLEKHIYGLEKLLKPVSYYASIRPANYAREEAVRAEKEAAKAARKSA